MRNRTRRGPVVGLAILLIGAGGGARAQQVAGTEPAGLSLAEALRLAEERSEQVTIARAAVQRARGQEFQARSQYFPQIFGSVGYTRTLASEFSALSATPDTTGPQRPSNCPGSFAPNPALPLDQRVDSLELALQCATTSNPFSSLKNLPFGRTNQWNLGLTFSQTLFSGGRVQAQNRAAKAGHSAAEIGLRSTRAQLVLDVTQAYFDAALADRLYRIAESTLAQSETALQQTRLARQVGTQPEFELLRAQVAYENQKPLVIQRRSDRDIAYMRLKQLLELPLDRPVTLTTQLGDSLPPVTLPKLTAAVDAARPDTSVSVRAPVRQAEAALRVQEAQAKVASAQRLPSLAISSQYGRVAYPETGLAISWDQFRSNWTVGASLQLPLFTGGRIKGDEMVAQANVLEARARLQQTRELAALDTKSALERLQAAQAAYDASAGTAAQATKAYQIADIRYREGISTQLELSDSRLLLEQAEANRAVAARDLQIARTRLALLPDLPLGTTAAAASSAASAPTAAPQTQQLQPQPMTPSAPGTQPRTTAVQASQVNTFNP
ncbi:MAG TPA: TolC family protein [Longimicrobiales bacterium]|nr:TolC family protein [Longimicrobiales bacterium]